MINVKVIAHKKQRYPTVGDWFYDKNGNLQIRVSRLSDPRYEQLIAVHEIVEACLCDQAGVDEQAVDAFDMKWTGEGEPGDDPAAPYHQQHLNATEVEKIMAKALGVDWAVYEKEINAL